MTAQPKASEPSMEEILASIRRIIADDQAKAAKAPEPAAPAPEFALPEPEPEADDVLDLTPDLRAGLDADTGNDQSSVDALFDTPAPEFTRPLDRHDFALDEPDASASSDAADALAEEIAQEQAYETSRYEAPVKNHDAYANGEWQGRETWPQGPAPAMAPPPSSLGLSPGLISQNVSESVGSAFSQLAHTVLAQNARTLDDLVQDMLRPMLKSWLDENLPTLVERLVRAEIERVARGGR